MRQAARFRAVLAALVLGMLPTASRASADPLPPAPAVDERFDVGTLHVERFGHGPVALILIPGLASGTWSWYGTIARERATHTVYALTLPGFDGRPAVTDRPLFAAFDRDFMTLLASRSMTKPIVIGHSLGGTLAIDLAERHPGVLRAIVAVDGLPVFPPLASLSADDRAAAAARVSASLAKSDAAGLLAYHRSFMQAIGTADPALVEPVARLMSRSDAAMEAQWASEDVTSDFRPGLGAITIPFAEIMPYSPQTVAGAPAYTIDQTKAFYQSLLQGATTAQVIPITAARHFVMLDRPDAFAAAVDAFLQSL